MGDSRDFEAGNRHRGKEEGKRTMDQFPSNNPNPVLRVDGEGTILYANKAAGPLTEYWGAGEGEKLPRAMVNKIKGILSQKNPEKLEINTEKKTYSVTFCPLPEDNCVYLQGFDISPFRQAEEELKKKYEELEARARKMNLEPSEAKVEPYGEIAGKKQTEQTPQDCPFFLETLMNTIPAPVLAKDMEGKYRECNELFSREITGLPKEEILGKTIKEVFPKLSPEIADAIHRQDLELLERGGKDSYETEFPCADGTVRNFLVNRAVFKDENGRTATMVAVMLDVSELRRNEKKIRNNVKFLETLLNTIPNPVFYKDSKGAYLGCNETFSKMITGLPKEEILGYTLPELADRFVNDFSPKFSTEEIRKLIENSDQYHREGLELIKTGESQLEEYEAFCADGRKRDFLTSRTAYHNEKGEVAGMVSVMQDITRIKQIERTLRNNLQFLETLINTIPNPVFYKDRNGVYIGCNEVFANRLFGLPREKIIGKTLPALQVPVTEELKEYCHRVALELARTGKKQENDLKFGCADGKTRDFIVNRAAFRNEEGEIAGIVGVMLDITQRKSAEEALQDTVSFLETLLDDIPSPVFQRDKNGIYLNCNETFASQIMGLPKEKVIGGSFTDFRKRVPKELAEIYQLHDKEFLRQGGSQYYEIKVVCADGLKRDFLLHKAAYKDSSGNVSGVVGVMLDITQRKEAEEIFRKSEEKFREVAERTGHLVYDYDLKTGQSSWAGAIEELTGYGYEEFQDFTPEAWAEHLHPEDRERAVEAYKKCLETGEDFHEEYRLRRKDGSYFYAEDSGFYLKDENGKVYRTPGVIKDITERKLSTQKIEESEKKFRIIAEQTGQGVYDYDVENDRLSWTGAIEKISGYRAEDPCISSTELWKSLIHPEDIKRADGHYEQALKEGKEYHQDYRIQRKDGNYVYVENNGVFQKDEKGRVYRLLGTIKDITERRLAREKLEKSEKKYRIAAEQTGQIVFEHDLKNEVIDWVGAIQELTGYSPEEFRKFDTEKWEEHVHPEDRKQAVERITEALEKGERFVEEYRFRRKDGDYFYVESCGIGMLDEEGKPFKALGVMKDITRRKLAREKLENNEERYRLATEQTGQIVCDLDLETGNIEWAGAIKELTGYGFEEFQKFTPEVWAEHIHPEDRESVLKNVEGYLKRGGRFKQEFRFRRKDGSYFYVENNGVILENERGQMYRILGLTKDITEQKLAREELEQSEERYRLISERTGLLLYHDSYMEGSINWSGAITKLTGYSVEEFQKHTEEGWLELIHPEDFEKVKASHEKAREIGGEFHEEYRFRRKDGSYFFAEDEGVYLIDEKRCIFKAVGVIKDITERKLSQKKLVESEERFRVATEQTGQIVFEHDHVNNVLSWEGAITEITGYSREEFQKFSNRIWAKHVHPEDREETLTKLRKFREKSSHFRVEYRFCRKDGSYFHVEDSGVYLRDEEGRIRKAIGVIKDITPIKLAAEKLQESEERFRIAAEKTGQLLYDYHIGSEQIRWAGAIEDISGYTHEEIHKLTTGELWKEHIHPEDYKKAIKYFREVYKTGESYSQEYRFKKKSGDYIYVEDCGTYLKDKEGRVYRMIGVIKDITERKLGTEEMRKSEERFRIVAEQTGQLVYDYDILDDKISWKGAIEELVDCGEEEFKKLSSLKDWKELIHPEDRKRVINSYKKCVEKGEKYCEEYRLKKKDGGYLCVENRGVFLKDETGRICRMLGTNKDITQIKHSLEKVRESEEKYRSFMRNFKGIAFQGDMHFSPVFMHGALEEITGYTEEELLSGTIPWPRLTVPEDRHLIYEDAAKLRTIPNTLIEREYRIRHKNGKLRWICELIQNISDSSGKPLFVQGSIYDITERKEAEEALARTEEIRKKEIHHRIKNNLQVISSLLELQSDQFREEKVVEAFRESQNRVASMAIIHEELYRAGDTETLDFAAYLRKLTSDLLRSYMVRKGDVKLKLEVEEIFLGMDTAIPLGIIVNELVSNALKHAFPAGRKGEIHVKLFRKESSGNKSISNITNNIDARSTINKNSQFTLIISDNGLGFPENVDFTNTDSLGLQLVNTLVEQLEGTIELERNGETVFRIKFLESGK
ncbi:sensory transduction histidine kinase [Methanosarcina sp. MTP4]|uniref:PAS domain-containing protein n=1 Tax=Methanosarcina sp. MTP4 TaxID=1434100 RepID=UPI00061545E5|nr:PAS domain-containing protein [Methanosarcina sp. MTP4]AKB24411.1 sensory transduction histidine kinase [Methanosarcina sp. MTP4]